MRFPCSLLAAVLVVASANCANATLILRVDNGATTGVTIHDAGTGDLDPSSAAVLLSNPSGDPFTTLVISAAASPTATLPAGYDVGITSAVTIVATTAQTVRIIVEQTGFSSIYNSLIANVTGSLTGAGSSVSFTAYANDSNLVPGLGGNVSAWGALAAVTDLPPVGSTALSLGGPFGPGLINASGSTAFVPAGTFSLFQVTTITFGTGGGTASWTYDSGIATPEPASLSLMGTGLLGLAAFGFRRRQRPADRLVSA
jgi:hypothetical protein